MQIRETRLNKLKKLKKGRTNPDPGSTLEVFQSTGEELRSEIDKEIC